MKNKEGHTLEFSAINTTKLKVKNIFHADPTFDLSVLILFYTEYKISSVGAGNQFFNSLNFKPYP